MMDDSYLPSGDFQDEPPATEQGLLSSMGLHRFVPDGFELPEDTDKYLKIALAIGGPMAVRWALKAARRKVQMAHAASRAKQEADLLGYAVERSREKEGSLRDMMFGGPPPSRPADWSEYDPNRPRLGNLRRYGYPLADKMLGAAQFAERHLSPSIMGYGTLDALRDQ